MLTGLCGIVGFVLGACALYGGRALGLSALLGVKVMKWARHERASEALFLLCCMVLPMVILEAIFTTFAFVTASASVAAPTAASVFDPLAASGAFISSFTLRLLGAAVTLSAAAGAY